MEVIGYLQLPAASPQEGTQFRTEQGGGWASEVVWTLRRREKYGVDTGTGTQDCPARSIVATEKKRDYLEGRSHGLVVTTYLC